MNPYLLKSLRQAKRLIVIAVGFSVLLIGIAMIVLPGPAFIVIPSALAVLATELIWARRLFDKLKKQFQKTKEVGQDVETKQKRSHV